MGFGRRARLPVVAVPLNRYRLRHGRPSSAWPHLFNSAIQPFAGSLSDRTGKRRVFVIAGLPALTAANFAFSLAGSSGAILLVNELPTDDARGESTGRSTFILAGLLLFVPATLAEGFVYPLGMGVVRFVQGVAGAAIPAPSMTLAGDIAAGRDSGTTMSVLTMAFGFGIAIGPLSAGYLSGVEPPFGQLPRYTAYCDTKWSRRRNSREANGSRRRRCA